VDSPQTSNDGKKPASTATIDSDGKTKFGEATIEIKYDYFQFTDTGSDNQQEEGSVAFQIMKLNVPKSIGPEEPPQRYVIEPVKPPGSIKWTENLDAEVCGFDAEANGTIDISGSMDDSDPKICRLKVIMEVTYGGTNLIAKNCPGGLVPYQLEPTTYGPLEFPLAEGREIKWDTVGGGSLTITLRNLTVDQEDVPCMYFTSSE